MRPWEYRAKPPPVLDTGAGEKALTRAQIEPTTGLGGEGKIEPLGMQDKGHYVAPHSLYLPDSLLQKLMSWAAKHHKLRVEHPEGVILNAQPHHVTGMLEQHAWGVVYDADRLLLMTWGDVPTVAFSGLRDLKTGELLRPDEDDKILQSITESAAGA